MYSKIKTFRTSETQYKTLQKMRLYNIDVSRFIRDAIREKIQREHKYLIRDQNDKSISVQCKRLLNDLKKMS